MEDTGAGLLKTGLWTSISLLNRGDLVVTRDENTYGGVAVVVVVVVELVVVVEVMAVVVVGGQIKLNLK